jgi:Na+-driven multidrug efflux pump
MFTPEFQQSADIFLVYLLLIIPRLIFPQTIVVGRKKTHIALFAAILELMLNIILSIFMLQRGYGVVGVAVSTFIVYTTGKLFLAGYVWIKMNISPLQYIPLKIYVLYSTLITLLFVLIDHRIIDIK